ncbi:TadE-like protein [Roseinatronobacter thiooxidans]|uniref:TadE-like protein n=1 Tax=Roseinatronobacter thiooxidans TaxID=121821 RepID=A0A2W7QCE2_9RHOB|nr:TadE/TadG family type IV pilus assembly protein [Roseinatronobacter thiooxidans]PZX36215.1 TadE-like protein [Roseinatronobacter thiooxidans]
MRALYPHIRKFRRSQSGAALVEFGISLPLILILAFGMIESMRLLWSFQAAVAGVRDATRYVARTERDNICIPSTGTLDISDADLVRMVTTSINGGAIFPAGITVTGVTATLNCTNTKTTPFNVELRQAVVPVVTVTANLTMQFPMTAVFRLAGGDGWGTINTSVVEQARIYGL